MKSLVGTAAVLALAGWCLALIPSAAGTTGTGVKIVHLHSPIEALAISGTSVAYDVAATPKAPNGVFVWNTRTGATKKVSGKHTAGANSTVGVGVNRLAIAGNQVAWRILQGGNLEADDYVFTSSSLAPKEKHVATSIRYGGECGAGGGSTACAGTWFGGFVTSGSDILVNKWTTDTTGAITGGGLYKLHGTTLKPFVLGGTAVEAVAADLHRIAVQQWQWGTPNPAIHVYSASGTLLTTVTPAAQPKQVALSGRNLLVLLPSAKLAVYDAQTGALKTTYTLVNPKRSHAIAVHGNIAVYSTAIGRQGYVRALNLTSGKDRVIDHMHRFIAQLCMSRNGVAYANYSWIYHQGYQIDLVYRPLAQVAAAVK
jgi:hypothetical protein